MEQYVKKGLSKSNSLEEVLARRQNDKIDELNAIKIDAMIAEEKEKLKKVSPPQIDSVLASNIAATLFAGRSPGEIKQILSTLTPEEIDRFAQIASSGNQSNLRGLMQPQNSSLKETIEIVKLIMEMQQPRNQNNGGNDMAGMAKAITEAMRLGADMAKTSQPPPQPQQQQDPMQVYKMVQEIVQPFQQQAANHERQLHEIQLKTAESKNVDPVTYLKNLKATAAELGIGGSGGASEADLKLEEMRQNKDLEEKKLGWEMKKWELDKEKEGSTLDTVKQILEGPAGEILKSIGGAASDRMREGAKAQNNSVPSQAQSPQIISVKCPNCSGTFTANSSLPMIQCPLCGVQLQNSNHPPVTQQEDSVPVQQSVPEQSPIPQPEQPSITSPLAQPPKNQIKEKMMDETVEVPSIAKQPDQQ
jgi:ribosomal protein S27E